MKRIYLAGGCFWGVEHYFSLIKGIVETSVGYANSNIENPSYEDLKQHLSNAAETVEIIYDSNVIDLKEILECYFKIIDPTSLNKQGNDIGIQYRTGIYYIDDEDLNIINEEINLLKQKYQDEIVIEIMKLKNYYLAEDYHQDYLIKNPNGYCHIGLDKFDYAKKYKN